jgi:hypothetical protein
MTLSDPFACYIFLWHMVNTFGRNAEIRNFSQYKVYVLSDLDISKIILRDLVQKFV